MDVRKGMAKLGIADLPRTYLAFDVETASFSPDSQILQIGHCYVEDGVVLDRQSYFLDWRSLLSTEQLAELELRVNTYEANTLKAGGVFHHTWAAVCAGASPRDVLPPYVRWFGALAATGVPVVTHNGTAFDLVLMRHNAAILGEPWVEPRHVDVGQLLRLSQPGRAKWSLHKFAAVVFGFDQEVSPQNFHHAGWDAYLTHLLYAKLSSLVAEGGNFEVPPEFRSATRAATGQEKPEAKKQRCSWAGCEKIVHRSLWGCGPHWWALPDYVRMGIANTYRPEQIAPGGTPSEAYVAACEVAQRWIAGQDGQAPFVGVE